MSVIHMKRLVSILLITGMVFILAACQPPGPKTTVGGLGGAAAGGLIGAAAGSGPEGIAAGVILGALLGGVIGDRLDANDRQYVRQTTYRALETTPTGASVPWQNPGSGHYGAVTPTRTYQTAQGTYCREYQQTVTMDGQLNQVHGTACRQPDGSWQVVD